MQATIYVDLTGAHIHCWRGV